MIRTDQRKNVVIWLTFVFTLIFLIIIVGGVTRLTHSGLSIVEWKPFSGVIPPLNEEKWNDYFEKYKQFPEYKIMNRHMDLNDFKFIFFWEYFHRMLGRLIGLGYLLPFLYFYFQRYFDKKTSIKLFTGFLLICLQGLIGWLMVKSGLVNDPRVSHYRLALHLSTAFGIAGFILWNILEISYNPRKNSGLHRRFKQSLLVTGGICLQIIYGAFTAGKKAGFGYNTFPKMDDAWLPDAVFSLQPAWLNFLETNAAIQFTHRIIAWCLILAIPVFLWSIRNELNRIQKNATVMLLIMLCIQFFLGIMTILYIGSSEVLLPSIHQAGAFILFSFSIFLNYTLYRDAL